MIYGNELLLYGDFGTNWFVDGIVANEVVAALRDYGDAKPLTVRINSQGGDVFEGVAVYNALRRREGDTTVVVDGLAASIASVVAMAGRSVRMSPASMMMIHEPWTVAAGNAAEMRKTAETLDTVRNALIDAYAGKVSDRQWLADQMAAETWYTAQEAVDAGLADSVDANQPRVAAKIDPGRFRNAPIQPAESRQVAAHSRRRQMAARLAMLTGGAR